MLSPGLPRAMAILVLYTQAEKVIKGEPGDLFCDQETAAAARAVSSALAGLGYRVACAGVTGNVAQALGTYSPREWVVFNLCESLDGDSALEATVPPVLEERGFAYTGSSGPVLAACLNKASVKARLLAAGLRTPRYAVLSSPDDACSVPLPAIAKPVAEDASLGITFDSVAREAAALRARVAYILERYRQPALVEEFIPGREFSVGVWGNNPPEPLPPCETLYLDIPDPLQRLQTYDAKWVETSFAYEHTPVVCPAEVGPELRGALVQSALAAYRIMGCRDYARVDMRERDGVPYILEINPNPAIAPYGSMAKAARVCGLEYAQLVERIAKFAQERSRAGSQAQGRNALPAVSWRRPARRRRLEEQPRPLEPTP